MFARGADSEACSCLRRRSVFGFAMLAVAVPTVAKRAIVAPELTDAITTIAQLNNALLAAMKVGQQASTGWAT
jgi:hypothetical protein